MRSATRTNSIPARSARQQPTTVHFPRNYFHLFFMPLPGRPGWFAIGGNGGNGEWRRKIGPRSGLLELVMATKRHFTCFIGGGGRLCWSWLAGELAEMANWRKWRIGEPARAPMTGLQVPTAEALLVNCWFAASER